jgi:pimeloyl-ACP methyl ester carboxylesterase
MNKPVWIKPAVYGAVVGAAALAIIGFSWGGWVTGATAQKMAENASSAAVVDAMTPYCIAQSKSDPNSAAVLAEMKAASSYQRSGIVEKAGWATPLGAEKPNSDVAKACGTALSAT